MRKRLGTRCFPHCCDSRNSKHSDVWQPLLALDLFKSCESIPTEVWRSVRGRFLERTGYVSRVRDIPVIQPIWFSLGSHYRRRQVNGADRGAGPIGGFWS